MKKLLLCVVASLMFSSNAYAGVTEGAITSSFTIESPTLVVSVPTSTKLYVNESFDNTVTDFKNPGDYKKASSVYSEPILISNSTMSSDRKTAVPVVATLYAALKPGKDVKVYYDDTKVMENGISNDKSVSLKLIGESILTKSSGSAGIGDIYDLKGDGTPALEIGLPPGVTPIEKDGGGIVTVTPYGSIMQIVIPGPSLNLGGGQSTPTYGGFALAGKANIEADWTDKDLSMDLYYRIKSTNNSFDADSNVKIGVHGMDKARDDNNGYSVLTAIKAAENLATTPTNAGFSFYVDTVAANPPADNLYFSIEGVDPSLTITKFGFCYQDKDGNWTDFFLVEGKEADYITENIYCKDKRGSGKDRVLYLNYFKHAGSFDYLGNLAKQQGKATYDLELIFVFSDGSVRTQKLTVPATK